MLASVITFCRQALEDIFQHLCNGDQRLPQAQRAAIYSINVVSTLTYSVN